jgi:hypothetical protein
MRLIKKIFIAGVLLFAGIAQVNAQSCDTITGTICKSIIADTVFNPYVTGVLGNWRANKSYTYYARRTEQDPTALTTNIRRDGTFKDFTTFWAFQSSKLTANIDTNRWVWNSELTLFNRKGFEVENRDPLGRYNAGLYGYNLTMPVAVVQNSRYRESAYEGFEDYVFATQVCDTACAATRHIDYSDWRSSIDTTQSHTGLRSLKVQGSSGANVGLSFEVKKVTQDDTMPRLNFITKTDACAGAVLDEISTGKAILLPIFSPVPDKRMLISAWVKEVGDNTFRASYTNNKIVVTDGIKSATFYPSGSIIEGWQRYESVFPIDSASTQFTISLQSIGANAVYFDDLRIHPFNANMKSFAFHPVNLRLMAELDENNYATLYEYDDDGTLIRLKKETQRGVKTIKETRSALVKEN